MEPIHPYDPAWLRTFQHLTAPQPDEWFPGLLLRCDEVNQWECGATMAHLLRSVSERRSRGRPNWVIVPPSVLELLTQLLALPMSSLLATTYQLELTSLYDTPSPHATYLCRSFPLHICPDCIAKGRLLKRTLILPHITYCPSHHVALVETCRCGTPLQLFARQSLPFTCQRCCLDWAKLPRLAVNKERVALEQKLMSYYAFFFANRTPVVLAKAQQLVREEVKKKKAEHVKSFNGEVKYVECYDAKRMALGHLVEVLISLNLTPDDIMAFKGLLPWWSMKTDKSLWSTPDDNDKKTFSEGLSTDNN